jgi:hypothetical protein
MMKSSKFALAAAALFSTSAWALDAASLKLQVYAVMLSTSPLCTSPVTVFSSASPTEVDFLATPTLGSGNPPDAKYECVIIKMSDLIKFTPKTSGGLCSSSFEYTADVCRADNGGTTQAPDGPTAVCHGTDPAPGVVAVPIADPVYLYLTTNQFAGGGGNTFMQPTDASSTNGLKLGAALVVAGTAKSKFVVNATNAVGSDAFGCGMMPPTFSFLAFP